MKKLLKVLHTLGAIGLTGAAAVHLLLLYTGPSPAPTPEFAATREALAIITGWVLLPSLVLVLISGLLAIAAHPPFGNFAWVWIKALLSLSIFQTTLMLVHGPVNDNADAAAQAVAGELDAGMLADALHSEAGALWVVLVVCVMNVVLAILRPRWRPPAARTRTTVAGATEHTNNPAPTGGAKESSA